MSNPKKDLKEKFTHLSSIVEEYAKVYRRAEEQKSTIETLRRELQDVKEAESVLQEQFGKALELAEVNTSLEYAQLLDTYKSTKQKVAELTHVVKQMKEEHMREMTNIKSTLEENYSSDKKQLIDKIAELERAQINNRVQFEKKETHLYEQLQLQQTNAAVRFDEMEMKYKSSLDKAANEHRVLTNTCNALRAEIFNIKSQMRSGVGILDNQKESDYEKKLKTLQDELNATKEHNSVLQNNLESAQARLKETTEQLSRTKINGETESAQNATNTVLNVDNFEAPFESNVEQPFIVDTEMNDRSNNQCEVPQNEHFNDSDYVMRRKPPQMNRWSRNVPIFRTSARGFSGGYRNRASLPPLRPIESAHDTKRKRKLYDPNDDSNI